MTRPTEDGGTTGMQFLFGCDILVPVTCSEVAHLFYLKFDMCTHVDLPELVLLFFSPRKAECYYTKPGPNPQSCPSNLPQASSLFSWFIQRGRKLKHKGDFFPTAGNYRTLFDAPVCQQRAKTSLSRQRRGKAGDSLLQKPLSA